MAGYTFADWLQWQLDVLDLAPTELARSIGVSHLVVTQWCFGLGKPSRELCSRLAELLEVPVDQVLDAAGW